MAKMNIKEAAKAKFFRQPGNLLSLMCERCTTE